MEIFDKEFCEILEKHVKEIIEKKKHIRTNLIERLEVFIYQWAMDREFYRNSRLKNELPPLKEEEAKVLRNKVLSLNYEETEILIEALRTEDFLAACLEAKHTGSCRDEGEKNDN